MTDREKVINNVKKAIEIMERVDEPTCFDDYIRESLEEALVILRAQNEADDQLAREKKMEKKPTYYSAVGNWLCGRKRSWMK